MQKRIFKIFNTLLIVLLILASPSNPQFFRKSLNQKFKEPAKFCGPRLIEILHYFCKFFHEPSSSNNKNYNLNQQESDESDVVDECCQKPCSILYLLLVYCKKPNKDAIIKVFGKNEIKLYERIKNNTASALIISMENLNKLINDEKAKSLMMMKTERIIHRKKFIHKKRIKKCSCNNKKTKAMDLISRKNVPHHILGFADYRDDNEPIIIAKYF